MSGSVSMMLVEAAPAVAKSPKVLKYDWISAWMLASAIGSIIVGVGIRWFKSSKKASVIVFCKNTVGRDAFRGATIFPLALVMYGIFDIEVLMEMVRSNRGVLGLGALIAIVHSLDGYFINNGPNAPPINE